MSHGSIGLGDDLFQYLCSISVHETSVQKKLRERTARLDESNMQISPVQGQFMALLVKLIGARTCLEVGVFTGYSALAVALALPAEGRLTACDVSEEWTTIGRRHWEEAGVADRIDLQVAPALETLDRLLAEGMAGRYDFAFIDADKTSYDDYYERSLKLLRSGGLLCFDNVLWGGAVADATDQSPDTVALRQLNEKLYADRRVDIAVVPIGDGLTLARKGP